ncbi:hypothetical protein FJT64_020912 [Amphibalanus amphitrite]|uniref:Myotonic dystrophy protein kinase coiled coil domain-containing protein n=1 Tax=Amphibalanus amphitrite TaxID=1232801 RepID=A0A6A4WZ27_AMPAM|nr:hypothetical protein FJT64_020912 [Amphibalanus amphitrite]
MVRLVPREQEAAEMQVLRLKTRVRELRAQLNQALTDKKRAENDLKELRATNSSTETKLRETEARNDDLEQTIASLMERLYELERTVTNGHQQFFGYNF